MAQRRAVFSDVVRGLHSRYVAEGMSPVDASFRVCSPGGVAAVRVLSAGDLTTTYILEQLRSELGREVLAENAYGDFDHAPEFVLEQARTRGVP